MGVKTKKAEGKKTTSQIRNVAAGDKEDEPSPKKSGPQKGWSDAALKKYGLDRLDDAARHEGSALLALALAGEAFAIVRDRLKPKHQWTGWLKGLGVRRQRAWKAIKVYEGAAREAAARGTTVERVLAEKTYTQAMEAWVKGEDEGTSEDEGGSTGIGGKRKTGAKKKLPTAMTKGKDETDDDEDVRVEPNGDIEITGKNAVVVCDLLRQVSEPDRARQLLVARSWDARTRAALSRQVAVLLVPELDDRCLPVTKEDSE